MSKRIIDLPSGSISDNSLGFIGDINTGALTETSFHAMKDYFLSGSFLLQTGSYVTTASFNQFSSSYKSDSASFSNFDKTSSIIQNGLTPTASFNPFTASYIIDSSSFDARLKAISGSIPSGSYVTNQVFSVYSASYTIDSRSFDSRISNIFNSESIYTPTASFNPFTASYQLDSQSFNNKISNVYVSESIYLPSSSFSIFSASYQLDSASFNTRIGDVYISESGYLPTASIFGNNNYIVVYSGSKGFTYGTLYQSGSSVLINQFNSLNDAILQVAGNVSINSSGYLQLPVGSTSQRPPTSSIGATSSIASFAMIRGNSDTAQLEFYNGSQWLSLGSGSGIFFSGSVTSVGLTLPPSLFNPVAGSPIVGAGTFSASLATQSAGYFFAAPTSSNGAPIFRPISIIDISPLTASFIGQFVNTASFNQFTSSYYTSSGATGIQILNVYASQSNYVLTSSFNAYSSSVNNFTASISSQVTNVYLSESLYTLTSSFLSFSSSYVGDSASNLAILNNIYASESNYLPTSSINGIAGYYGIFSSSNSIYTGSIRQSGSQTIISSTITNFNGSIYLSSSIYDSTNSTGSNGQVLGNAGNGVLWISTGSGGWQLSGNSISSGSFIGTTNAQDLIFKRNNIQVAAFLANNNIILGNVNNSVTGSNAVIVGGVNGFANNMATVINGNNNIATGNSSVIVGGQNNNNAAIGSVILGGTNLSSSAGYAIVLGRFNDPISGSTPGSWVNNDPLLIIGNGSSTSSVSNAMIVYKTGSLSLPYYSNTLSSSLAVGANGLLFNLPIVPSASYYNDSSSFNSRINSVLTTTSFSASISGSNGFIPIFNGSNGLTNSAIQSFNTNNGKVFTVSGSIQSFFSIASGSLTTALGNGCYAVGFGSMAVGGECQSIGILSFAQGADSVSNGFCSHAEGNSTSNGEGSHSEGFLTISQGKYSHAEGSGSVAVGGASHAEGLFTVASGSNQTVVGQYNALNNTSSLFIVGNGTSASRADLAQFNSSSVVFFADLYLSSSIHISQSIYDSFGNVGQPGQILTSTSGGIQWTNSSGSSGINGFVTNGVFQTYTSSIAITVANVYASESNYTPTSSYISLSGSVNVYSGSYYNDSSSFNARINAISGSILNLTGSYVTTGSFNSYTQSVSVQLSNIYASESKYLLTSSLNGITNYIPVFSGQTTLITSSIYQSGSSLIIGGNTGSNKSYLQTPDIYISKNIYDSIGSTGSINQVISSTSTGIKWVNTGSGGGFVSGSTSVLNFIIGDGGPYTPISGSTQLSASILANRTILQFFQEGLLLAPISRSVACYSVTSSNGIINLNNAEFDPGTFYSILYT